MLYLIFLYKVYKHESNEMNDIEFCYWLQGFFELYEPLSLNSEHCRLIKNHLDMVFYLDEPFNNSFCPFLMGIFEYKETLSDYENMFFTELETKKITDKLNSIFIHEVFL